MSSYPEIPLEIQVEVTLQDCYWATSANDSESGLEAVDGDRPSRSPIETATWEQWFQQWLTELHPEISPIQVYELSLRLTDDAEIQTLNAQYRDQNRPTDVLAFAALEVDHPQVEEMRSQPTELGDIVISIETAQAQAQQQGHPLTQELAWLAAHGLLHLLGWDHPDQDSLTQMLQQQEALLQTIGLATGYDWTEADLRHEVNPPSY